LERLAGALLSGDRGGDDLLHRRAPAVCSDRPRAGERLDTPAIAAAAHRSVGLDRLVAELAGGSDPEVQAPVDDDSAAHAGPDGHEHGRAATAGGTELRLA